MTVALEIIFDLSVNVKSVWNRLFDARLKDRFENATVIWSDESKTPIEAVAGILTNSDVLHLDVEVDSGRIYFCPVRSHDVSVLIVDGFFANQEKASSWVAPFAACSNLIQARVYDVEFNYWQNAKDIRLYKKSGRKYDHLPLTSNNLPFPLHEKIVDISENPGRRLFKDGYLEEVGSVMWLGGMFWGRTGNERSMVLGRLGVEFELDQTTESTIKLVAFNKPFTHSDGMQGELQRRLRELLFG